MHEVSSSAQPTFSNDDVPFQPVAALREPIEEAIAKDQSAVLQHWLRHGAGAWGPAGRVSA